MSSIENHIAALISEEEIIQNLLLYLQRVAAGETFVILKGGKPMAEIKPITFESKSMRPFGLCAGEF
jgi:antitoxin (DNA-binding transcriptional repressor) of toxin-antitoxin stability system